MYGVNYRSRSLPIKPFYAHAPSPDVRGSQHDSRTDPARTIFDRSQAVLKVIMQDPDAHLEPTILNLCNREDACAASPS